MKAGVALHRLRAPVGHQMGGYWLQVAGGCSLKVQINVVCQGGYSSLVIARAGGCLSKLDCTLEAK